MTDAMGELCLGLGEVLWDLLPGGRALGGAPANFACHAQALGGRGAVASAVGDDPDGRNILQRLRQLGLDTSAIAVDPRHATGTVTVGLAAGQPSYTIHGPVAWDFIPAGPELLSLAGRADAVCFGSLAQRGEVSRAGIRAALDATQQHCLRVFDANLRQNYCSAETIRESLARADVLKLNHEELPTIAGLLGLDTDESDALAALRRDWNLRLVVMTSGRDGSMLVGPEGVFREPSQAVDVVDTVGAGDSFTAAVTIGLLRGVELPAILKAASRLAEYVCTQAGATPEVPEEVRSFPVA